MKCVCSVCLVILLFASRTSPETIGKEEVHSRHKRYLAFPEGSTFVVTLCETVATILPFEIYYEGINWGVAYDLPNVTSVRGYVKNKHEKRRRHRRDLYIRFESIIDARSQCAMANNNNSHSFPHRSLRGPKGLLFGK
ncbi:hypothetical protein NQ318_001676 [Aromia moschata]|uniref:Secreted protein n=1 Tax=Aromia moschata TaxID=1265417 RepID=A0AAV8X835_9CUCU|nr:hypothetical protein NQ318_001676 [Aromia moschata]